MALFRLSSIAKNKNTFCFLALPSRCTFVNWIHQPRSPVPFVVQDLTYAYIKRKIAYIRGTWRSFGSTCPGRGRLVSADKMERIAELWHAKKLVSRCRPALRQGCVTCLKCVVVGVFTYEKALRQTCSI